MRDATIDAVPRGWGWTLCATIIGTGLCTAIVGWFNSAASQAGNLLLAAVVAAPLLFLLANGVRRLAAARRSRAISASTDPLTGLLTRQTFTKAAENYLATLRDAGRPGAGALLLVDIDNLKAINDAFDHETGDAAIRMVASALRSAVRSTDLIGRLGGEEFGILLVGVDQMQSQMVADRLCRAVDAARFAVEDVEQQVTVSVGIGLYREDAALPDLIAAADGALYAAKENGRNRVAISPVKALRMAA